MDLQRRVVLGGMLSAPAILRPGRASAAPRTLKISHQFPGGTVEQGDFRDRLVRRFAAEVASRTNNELAFEIYPGSSLMKTVAQFSALRRGALDMSLYPLAYAGGEVPEVNIGLMPCLVSTYAQGMAWKTSEIGRELTAVLDKRGVKILTWIWQSGGVASRAGGIVSPDDTKGLKVRGGSREMDLMLKAAGAAVVSLPSNEIYAAMQTGAMDAALTSSTSLISFRLEEVSKALTTGRNGAYWFMFEPLMMSKAVYDKLTKEQQAIIMAVGGELEAFARKSAQLDDSMVAAVYQRVGAKVVDLSPAIVKKWQTIARTSVWKDYADKNANCAKLLALAEKTL
ncbi:MAG: C4-dicarboxylate transporter [Massilia sp.]|nr:C4-dicarboxylate transporter [Massilia sp.]